jgi:hypothetical protein
MVGVREDLVRLMSTSISTREIGDRMPCAANTDRSLGFRRHTQEKIKISRQILVLYPFLCESAERQELNAVRSTSLNRSESVSHLALYHSPSDPTKETTSFSLLPEDGVCINVLNLNSLPDGSQIVVDSLTAFSKRMIIIDNDVASD